MCDLICFSEVLWIFFLGGCFVLCGYGGCGFGGGFGVVEVVVFDGFEVGV